MTKSSTTISNNIFPAEKLNAAFFRQNAITVAEKLLGKTLVRQFADGTVSRYMITETEAYLGEEDEACHASKGRTPRTEVMYHDGGTIYIYLIYGLYWMLNVVTGTENNPQAVLIRAITNISGPGRVGRELKINKELNGENLLTSQQMWIENAPEARRFTTTPRIGVDCAGETWRNKPWRFILEES